MMRVLNVTLVPEAGPPHERSVRREAQPLRRRWVERFSPEIAEQRDCAPFDDATDRARARLVIDVHPQDPHCPEVSRNGFLDQPPREMATPVADHARSPRA